MKETRNRLSANGKVPYRENTNDRNICIARNGNMHPKNEINDIEKMRRITEKFADIMEILGLNLNNDSLDDTPYRVAKMYVKEVFKGLNQENKPGIKVFGNTYAYKSTLIELKIPFTSFCEHHFIPIQGKATLPISRMSL